MIEALFNAIIVQPIDLEETTVWKHCSTRSR
jgi:hypothetical protein